MWCVRRLKGNISYYYIYNYYNDYYTSNINIYSLIPIRRVVGFLGKIKDKEGYFLLFLYF